MPYRDLREYLALLEKKGLLCHIQAEKTFFLETRRASQ